MFLRTIHVKALWPLEDADKKRLFDAILDREGLTNEQHQGYKLVDDAMLRRTRRRVWQALWWTGCVCGMVLIICLAAAALVLFGFYIKHAIDNDELVVLVRAIWVYIFGVLTAIAVEFIRQNQN